MSTSTERASVRAGSSLRRLPVVVLSVLVLFFFGLPVMMLIVGAFRTGEPGLAASWTLAGLQSVYTSADTYTTLKNSVILSLTEHAVGLSLGFVFAWVVVRTNTPLRRLVTPMMVVIFAVPQLFIAISYGLLAGSPNGLANRALVGLLGGPPRAVVNVYSWWGLIVVSTLKVVPVMYLLVLGPVRAMNRSLEEASVIAGANRFKTFFRIQVPVLAPVLSGLAVLGFVIGLGLLDTPLILGVPAGIYVFPSRIYDYIGGGASPQYDRATALSLLLVVFILILVGLRRLLLGSREFTTVTGKGYSTERWDIGGWKWVFTAAIVIYGFFALILPVGQLIIGSLQPIYGIGSTFTLDNYREALQLDGVGAAIANTVITGLAGGFLATALAVVIGYTARRSRSRLRSVPEYAVWMITAFPGIVLGLGMVWAYLTVPVLRNLYGSVWIVTIALVVYISPTAGRAIEGAIAQIDEELEESARMSGAGQLRVVGGIVARLILPSFLATWFVAGVAVAGNLDVPLLLAGPGNQTVPVLAFNLYRQSGQTAAAAALLCLLMAIVAGAFLLLRVSWLIAARGIAAVGRRRLERDQRSATTLGDGEDGTDETARPLGPSLQNTGIRS